VYSLQYIATIKEANSTAIDLFGLKLCSERNRITHHYSAELQTTKQVLTTSKYSIKFTYSDFPCHLKVNRAIKLSLINRRWRCNKDKKFSKHCLSRLLIGYYVSVVCCRLYFEDVNGVNRLATKGEKILLTTDKTRIKLPTSYKKINLDLLIADKGRKF